MDRIGDSFGFECATCGTYHVGMPSFGWDWPIQYLMVPETDRARRTRLTPDWCTIGDDQFFVRGSLEVHVHGHEEPFSWGVWVSLSRTNFERYSTLHDDPEREAADRFVCWLCSAIPGYPDVSRLKAAVHVRPWPSAPFVDLEPTDHPLALEQRNGITTKRVHEIAQSVMHSGV